MALLNRLIAPGRTSVLSTLNSLLIARLFRLTRAYWALTVIVMQSTLRAICRSPLSGSRQRGSGLISGSPCFRGSPWESGLEQSS